MAAARVLLSVIDKGQGLDAALGQICGIGDDQGPLLRELSYGSCRYYILIDMRLSGLLEKPVRRKERLVHFVMVVAIYRLEYMRTPDHAVVNEAVNALEGSKVSWARRFVNAVLRRYIRQHEKLTQQPLEEYVSYAFCEHLFARLKTDWPQHYAQVAEASNARPPLTLRVNERSTSRASYAQQLDRSGVAYALTEDSPAGVVITHPVPVQEIPGFQGGMVSVQDESAQFAAAALESNAGDLRVLDACAAPGGKTCHLLEIMSGDCELTALDFAQRTPLIRENILRLDVSCTVIDGDILNPDAWWDKRRFDRILLDVPCSGSGIMRRHPDIKHRRRQDDCERFHHQQVLMLESMWKLLRPGGILLYVTCSVFRRENDESIEAFIHQEKDCELADLPSVPGIRTGYGVQRLPGVHHGDGFYYCKLRKALNAEERNS